MTTIEQEALREPLSWVDVISLNHVHRGIAGGFMQADHGSDARLRRLQVGDRVVFYSPRTDHPDGAQLQQFTAWGVVTGGEPYQVRVTADFQPWRRTVRFEPSVPVPIRQVLGELSFVTDQAHWGMPFRRGLFTIPDADFDRIITAMGRDRLAA
jgi:hypothetical protein